jgi:hypothetical protein
MLKLVEQQTMNPSGVTLADPTCPNPIKSLDKPRLLNSCENLVNKRDILVCWEDERELLVCGRKKIINAVLGSIDDLDVLHAAERLFSDRQSLIKFRGWFPLGRRKSFSGNNRL